RRPPRGWLRPRSRQRRDPSAGNPIGQRETEPRRPAPEPRLCARAQRRRGPNVGSFPVNAVPNPIDPPPDRSEPPISLAAERARAQLHEEIERVRGGVEEMLAEQGRAGAEDEALRREVDALREDTRLYVKK